MSSPEPSSPLASSGAGADHAFSDQPAGDPSMPCKKKTWIAIELLDDNGQPVPGKAYRIQLPDGRKVEGTLDSKGTAGVSGIDPGTCQVTFPDLDAKSWMPA